MTDLLEAQALVRRLSDRRHRLRCLQANDIDALVATDAESLIRAIDRRDGSRKRALERLRESIAERNYRRKGRAA